jgi:hypothetical protein
MLNKLGKLLKYEFRFYLRILPPLYLVLILLSLILRFKVYHSTEDSLGTGLSIFFLMFAWNAMVIAIGVVTLILIIQRYIDNFMKDPGALMFTLPVTVWALAAANVIAAVSMTLMGTLTVVISGAIHFKGADSQFITMIAEMWKNVDSTTKIIMAPVGFIMMFQSTCLIYLVITASYLIPRFRFVAACAMYFAITGLLEQNVFKAITSLLEKDAFKLAVENMWDMGFISRAAVPHVIAMGIASLAFTALYFGVTGFLLQRKFNLE